MSLYLAIHTKHDANLTLSDGNTILMYLELEKMSGERYFAFSEDAQIFQKQWQDWVVPHLPVNAIEEIEEVILCWVHPNQEKVLRELFPRCRFSTESHHFSHAASCYVFTQASAGDLILSYDGGGDMEDVFKVFWNPDGRALQGPIYEAPLNLGTPYRLLGIFSPELAKEKEFKYDHRMDLPGKIMGLAAYGTVCEDWKESVRAYLNLFQRWHAKEKKPLEEGIQHFLNDMGMPQDHLDWEETAARDLLATLQEVFTEIVLVQLRSLIEKYCPQRILMVGGCALNVSANSRVASTFNLSVFIPPCPNDCGISLGAMKIRFPDLEPLASPYLGPSVSKLDELPGLAQGLQTNAYAIENLAKKLHQGKVLGIVKGPLEIGPRALGHRSILASPSVPGMKDRINEIKQRDFYRPVAPMILASAQDRYFFSSPESPYMSFAPHARPAAQAIRESLHEDETARVQTVGPECLFLQELLTRFQSYSGHPVLLNTSLNPKGQPLLNDVGAAIELLRTTKLDALVVEDVIIEKSV